MYLLVLGFAGIFIYDIVKKIYLSKHTINKKIISILILVILVIPIMDLPYYFKGGVSEQVQFRKVYGENSRRSLIIIYETINNKLYWSDDFASFWMYFRESDEKCTIKYLPITRLIVHIEQGQRVLYSQTDGTVLYVLVLSGYLLFREIARGTFFKPYSD